MSCHHGLQHSIRFRAQWLQTRFASSAARGKSSQPKRVLKPIKPTVPGKPAVQPNIAAPEIPATKQLLSEIKGNTGVYEFPEKLLVYQPGAGKTATVAFIKMAGLISFCVGTIYYGTQAIADETQSNWRVLKIAVIAAIPTSVITLLTASYVAGIHIHLPITARASLNHLNRFISSMPPSTKVTFTSIRFLPWRALTTTTTYGSLSKLRPRLGRIANVKWDPRLEFSRFNEGDAMVGSMRAREAEKGEWMAQTRFFVPGSDVAMKRSRAPGVWKAVWEKLPEG